MPHVPVLRVVSCDPSGVSVCGLATGDAEPVSSEPGCKLPVLGTWLVVSALCVWTGGFDVVANGGNNQGGMRICVKNTFLYILSINCS